MTEELHPVSTSEVKTIRKLASAGSEEVILLQQHKSLIGFLAFPAIQSLRQFLLSSYTLPTAGVDAYVLIHQLSVPHACQRAYKAAHTSHHPPVQGSVLSSPAGQAALTFPANALLFAERTARTSYLSNKSKIAFLMKAVPPTVL